ncbi:MAG: cytidylate kinase-like family protein [Desulfuromonadaceae bacterium]|nr:cytidylate kinase-like family protein [Desulfuromonadaceae bacterium]MDD2855412.1 cytidylate kinase-like family protein [Desulfuromonadaceae bacterium]
MPENLMIPSVDLRIGSLEEYNRRQKEKAAHKHQKAKPRPCITISREYGCEGYPVAGRLREILMQKTGDEWVLIDKDILEEVSKHHNISNDILETLGENNRILKDVLATFSPRWKSDQEYFRMLSKHIVALAEQGNVIICELGGAVITSHIEHSFHFRIYGSDVFKTSTLAGRLKIENEAAETLMHRQQKARDHFNKLFLDQNAHDPLFYDMMFNNDRLNANDIAHAIAEFVCVKHIISK